MNQPSKLLTNLLEKKGTIDPIFIIGPPRSNSTLTQWVISRSPDINQRMLVEPLYQHRDQPRSISLPLENISQSLPEFGNRPFTIKDSPHRVLESPNNSKLLTLTKRPALLLIRDPFLALISRIKKTLLAGLLNDNNFDLLQEPRLSEIKTALKTQDYATISWLLDNEGFFPTHRSGWEKLTDLITLMESQRQPFSILDTGQLRNDPESTIQAVCQQLEIATDLPKMTHWTKEEVTAIKLNPLFTPKNLIFFKEIMNSTGIQPESVISKESVTLPEKISNHLEKVQMPIFEKLREHPSFIEGNVRAGSPEAF